MRRLLIWVALVFAGISAGAAGASCRMNCGTKKCALGDSTVKDETDPVACQEWCAKEAAAESARSTIRFDATDCDKNAEKWRDVDFTIRNPPKIKCYPEAQGGACMGMCLFGLCAEGNRGRCDATATAAGPVEFLSRMHAACGESVRACTIKGMPNLPCLVRNPEDGRLHRMESPEVQQWLVSLSQGMSKGRSLWNDTAYHLKEDSVRKMCEEHPEGQFIFWVARGEACTKFDHGHYLRVRCVSGSPKVWDPNLRGRGEWRGVEWDDKNFCYANGAKKQCWECGRSITGIKNFIEANKPTLQRMLREGPTHGN